MGESTASLDATSDAIGRASFATVDVLRRALGHALGAFGLDPDECSYRIVGFGPHWRLRDYGGDDRSLSLLIVATPIKRAYIWDLAPSVSAVRYCMRAGLHVHLLEWMPASQRNQNNGLDEYAEAISECVAKISCQAAGTTPLCRGTLKVSEILVGPSSLSVPALAIVTTADEVAPLASVKPFIDATPATGVRIIQYPGEVGVGLQHLGILVGRQARAHVWPEIVSWIKTHS